MSLRTFFFPLFLLFLTACSDNRQLTSNNHINPLIGDVSYEKKFGRLPGESTDEKTRIQTHLEYVEMLLRKKDMSNMPQAARNKRNNLLNLLHEYHLAAKFPANYDHAERRPCFIDRDGNICAVGYLVEKTAGRSLAEKINQQYKYDNIADMKTPELLAWVETSGLTAEECAMIQPTYGWHKPDNYVPDKMGIATAAWSGLNLAIDVTSTVRFSKPTSSRTLPFIGMASGAGQIVYGIISIPKEGTSWTGTAKVNNAQKNIAFLNIGIGTATMFLNGFNYFLRKGHSTKNSYGVNSFQIPNNQTAFAFTYTRKL